MIKIEMQVLGTDTYLSNTAKEIASLKHFPLVARDLRKLSG